MADVSIRKLDDWVVEALKARAQAHDRSLEEEMRQTLAESVLGVQRDFAKEVERIQKKMRAKYGILPSSTPRIREDRDNM